MSPTIASTFSFFNWAMAARADSSGGAYRTHGCLFESIVRPRKPMRSVRAPAFTGTTAWVTVPAKGCPSLSVTLDETMRNFDSAMRARRPASPMSNSWLPNVAQSTPSAFNTPTICRPARRSPSTRAVPSAEGDT